MNENQNETFFQNGMKSKTPKNLSPRQARVQPSLQEISLPQAPFKRRSVYILSLPDNGALLFGHCPRLTVSSRKTLVLREA